MTEFAQMNFPNGSNLLDGFWQPIFFRSNFDTPERLVVAILAFAEGRWSIERANSLEKLKCLYGAESVIALDVIQYGLDELQSSLAQADAKPVLNVSGLELGERREAQAKSADELAKRWLSQVSSLHSFRKDFASVSGNTAIGVDSITRDISNDRLSVLVMEHVVNISPQSRPLFNPHVHRLERDESARHIDHGKYVAFDGKKVAANFSTIKPGRNKNSVDISKRLMWDLEQHRGQEISLLDKQQHEMFLFHPKKDDPTISIKQYDNVMEVVETLRREGSNRDIKVVAKDSVEEISRSLILAEGLA